MSIRPWRDIAIPHQDVLKGSFQQSEFAADISQVQQGKAPPEYQDARQFFARTFITEGMHLLLDKVMRRLAGQAGDPVIQLQTAFGGGKTHTLMAVFHIAERDCPISELAGVPPILDAAAINDLPKAKVAVLDGINLSPSSPKEHGSVRTHTLWGELAWQLGGNDGYAMVRAADAAATSPDKDLGHYKDALRRLRDQLNYLNAVGNRYWFDTRPNLRREMESRRQRFSMKDDIEPLLRERVQRVFGKDHLFEGIHVFTPSVDIPDDYGSGPRLVVLPPAAPYRKGKDNPAERAAEEVLTKRGEQPRQKQNRLLFLTADADALERLKDQTRTYMAWVSIVTDVEAMRLNLDQLQAKQAKDEHEESGKALLRTVRDTFRWLLSPVQEVRKGRLDPTILWEAVQVSAAAQNLAQEIQNKLRDNGWLITQWSPIHLANIINTWYCKDGNTEVGALKVWQDTSHYLYLPRLTNSHVFQDAIRVGIETKDFFGFASGKQGDKYLGFAFGRATNPVLDEAALMIEREAAAAYEEPQPDKIEPQKHPVFRTKQEAEHHIKTQPQPTDVIVKTKKIGTDCGNSFTKTVG